MGSLSFSKDIDQVSCRGLLRREHSSLFPRASKRDSICAIGKHPSCLPYPVMDSSLYEFS